MDKSSWRMHFEDQLRNLSSDFRRQSSRQITENVRQIATDRKWIDLVLFQAFRAEPDLSALFSDFRCAFPKMLNEGMHFIRPQHYVFKKSRLGFFEPAEGEEVVLEKTDVILIPGLGFDRQGTRLGRGKGYYDRVLSEVNGKRPIKAGVCFESQLVESLPHEEHDVMMDLIITEQAAYWVKESRE